MLLEAYIPAKSSVSLPDFLDIVREVTKEKEFSMYNIAVKEKPKSLAEKMADKYRQSSEAPPLFGDK